MKPSDSYIIFEDRVNATKKLVKNMEWLKKENFRKIFVACTHPVFIGDSVSKIKKSGVTKIVGTNSIEGKFSKIDLSDVIVDTIVNWK